MAAKNGSASFAPGDVPDPLDDRGEVGRCGATATAGDVHEAGDRVGQAHPLRLVRFGIPAGRVSTVSYGEERPLDPGHNELAWALNRRAHFLVRTGR